jgi:hypothetical protein
MLGVIVFTLEDSICSVLMNLVKEKSQPKLVSSVGRALATASLSFEFRIYVYPYP